MLKLKASVLVGLALSLGISTNAGAAVFNVPTNFSLSQAISYAVSGDVISIDADINQATGVTISTAGITISSPNQRTINLTSSAGITISNTVTTGTVTFNNIRVNTASAAGMCIILAASNKLNVQIQNSFIDYSSATSNQTGIQDNGSTGACTIINCTITGAVSIRATSPTLYNITNATIGTYHTPAGGDAININTTGKSTAMNITDSYIWHTPSANNNGIRSINNTSGRTNTINFLSGALSRGTYHICNTTATPVYPIKLEGRSAVNNYGECRMYLCPSLAVWNRTTTDNADFSLYDYTPMTGSGCIDGN